MTQPEEIFVERCNLYTEYGFTVVSMASNNRIGRLCAIRKSDYPRSSNKREKDAESEKPSTSQDDKDTKDVANAYFVVEFYNVTSPPSFFLEKSVPVWDPQLESVSWVGNVACVTCSDGSVRIFSPFSHNTERYQLCASSIISSAPISGNQLALGTESGEVMIAQYSSVAPADELASDESSAQGARKSATLRVTQRLKLSVEEQLVCLATSKADANVVAVGVVNGIYIYDLQKPDQPLHIVVPHTRQKIVIWSMVFVDQLLFTGDSMGEVTIYNAKNGAKLKNINAHQNAVIAMATNGISVFTAGVDQRIQVISGIQNKDVGGTRYDWTLVGQRLNHSNDVTALACIGEWLASGGAEHDIVISDRHFQFAHPILRPTCSVARIANDDGCLILMRHPHSVQLWYRPDCSSQLRDQVEKWRLFEGEKAKAVQMLDGPKKLIQINVSESLFISQSAISPDGDFIAFSTDVGLRVYRLNVEPMIAKPDGQAQSKRAKTMTTKNAQVLVKYWDSEDSEEFDYETHVENGYTKKVVLPPPSISALLMLSDEMYFAQSDFAIHRVSFRPTSRRIRSKVFVEKKGAGQILKLCSNPSKSFLLAITTNSQVLRISTSHSDRADDENAESADDDSSSNTVQTLNFFNYSPFDCAFVAEDIALFACVQQMAQLVFANINTCSVLKVLTRNHLRIGYHQFVCGMSDVRDDRVFVVTNKGKVRTLSGLENVKPVMHLKEKADESTISNRRESRKHDDSEEFYRTEPFWGFSYSTQPETQLTTPLPARQRGKSTPARKNKAMPAVAAGNKTTDPQRPPNRTLLLIGHIPLSSPSQAPMRKRGFELN